jgi:hypothetical protein
MIRYDLKCPEGHDFDSWFQSAAAFDSLLTRGLVACPSCGSGKVEKALMAPSVRPSEKARAADVPADRPLSAPANPVEAALAEMRRHVEQNSEYVGLNFVTEARRMHTGDAPERAIHGEAKPEEARALIAEGVPVAPLPFLPRSKTN